jgi:hypothetical protein
MALESLGHVDVRNGTLVVFDFGLIGAWAEEPHAPQRAAEQSLVTGAYGFEHAGVGAVAIPHLPPGRYPMNGIRIDDGAFRGLRQAVMIELVENDPPAARTIELGKVPVDEARIGVFDADAIAHWNDSVPVDGLADVLFWGLHENEVAQRYRAPRQGEDGFGFVDLPVDQAEQFARELDGLRSSGQFRFAYDFRPHSHPYHLLAQMRKNASEAGVLDVGGSAVCGLFTSWGDGLFPVMLDLDANNRPIRCGVFFATTEAQQNLRAVNS